MSSGWIKLHRKIFDNSIWTAEPFSRGQAWVDLILLANHKEGIIYVRGNKVNIKRGMVAWSQKRLSERWQWSRGKVSRFLHDLEKEGQIEQQKNFITSLITIVKYCDYQETDSRRTADGQQTEQQTDTNKNDKKVKNDKNSYSAFPFDEFWDHYDKKIDRKRCQAIYARISEENRMAIKRHIPQYKKQQPDPQYRKNPATYLRGENWTDQIIHINENGNYSKGTTDHAKSLFDRFQSLKNN